jgi:hypothetical protein
MHSQRLVGEGLDRNSAYSREKSASTHRPLGSSAMTQHLIWTAGFLGHLVLLGVLIVRGRAQRFPFFTLLILFYLLRSLTILLLLGHLAPPGVHLASLVFDVTDLLLECAVLTQLVLAGLGPLDRLHRILLPLLLVVSAALIVTHLVPVSHYYTRAAPLLLHYYLAVFMLEWSLVLFFLLRSLGLTWRSHVATITFGFGIYAAALLFAGGYFSNGRELREYIFFSYFRICIYLLVLLWWIVTLWRQDPSQDPSRNRNQDHLAHISPNS